MVDTAPTTGGRPNVEDRAPRETTAAPTPSTPQRTQEIYIDSIAAGNPVIIHGRARTFENAVSLRARDARGEVLAETHVTSMGEMGRHNPFEARLWIVREPGEQVIVEAFEYSAKDGAIQSLTRKTVPYDVQAVLVTLMFPVGDCQRVAAFTRKIPKSVAMARLLSEALVAGPQPQEKAEGATPPFPKGSEVRSVILRDGELTVDFNERLQNVGGSCAALAIRETVVQTLTRLPGVKRVTITANGSKELALQP